jgi:hypothetical protein
LPIAFQVLGVARTYVRALKVASEDLSEILLANDDVSWYMIQSCPSRVN